MPAAVKLRHIVPITRIPTKVERIILNFPVVPLLRPLVEAVAVEAVAEVVEAVVAVVEAVVAVVVAELGVATFGGGRSRWWWRWRRW